ncbi:MAG: ABC transporter ATP-binding protein [Rhodobacteraceae bacterium]|nr:ABC transporter ATP-binding protein [Paracoccaceae bacterium]
MARVTLDRLTMRFGPVTAVDGIDLEVAQGEFVVFLGPSGCGKTTTLRCIAGLETPTAGRILFDDEEVGGLDALHRNVAMVFQFVSLYPHLTVRQNIAFPLQARGVGRDGIRRKIDWVTRIFDLAGILDSRPGGLPPGARQKAALARAVVREPRVLLLDEPLSAIDEQFREEMRWELRHLQKELGVTAIYVTHDQREAMSLADRIVLMRDGRIEQAGLPADIFADPASAFAGFFIGSPAMNFLPARREGGALVLAGGAARMALPAAMLAACADAPVQVGIRPQHVAPGGDPAAPGAFAARIVGRHAVARERWFDFALGEFVGRGAGTPEGAGNEGVVQFDLGHLHLFTEAGARLRPAVG